MTIHFIRIAGLCAVLVTSGSEIQAQSSSTQSRMTIQGGPEQLGTSTKKDAVGKPCLDVEAAARPETVNPAMLDHVISIKNNCPKLIKVKACYFNSDRCNEIIVAPYKRVDTILGTMRGVGYFRYSILEK